MPFDRGKTTYQIYAEGQTTREITMLVRMVLVVRGFRTKLDEELRKIDQSAARMETLAALLNMPGEVSQSDVARRLRIEGATVTRMIDILGKEGLVERFPHPSDRRINLLRITPAGEEALRDIFRVYDSLRGHLLKGMAPDEIETMHGLIDRMLLQLDAAYSVDLSIADMPEIDRLRDRMKDNGQG